MIDGVKGNVRGLIFLGVCVLLVFVGMALIGNDAFEKGFESGVEFATGNDYDVGCVGSCMVDCMTSTPPALDFDNVGLV